MNPYAYNPVVAAVEVLDLHDVKDLLSLERGLWTYLGPELSALVIAEKFAPADLIVCSGALPGPFERGWSRPAVFGGEIPLWKQVGPSVEWDLSQWRPMYTALQCPRCCTWGCKLHRMSWPEDKEPAVSPADVAACTGAAIRLRPRGRLTRSLEGCAVRNGWWRDLPGESPAAAAVSWLCSWTSGRVKFGQPRPISLRPSPASEGEQRAVGETATAVPIQLEAGEAVGQCLWICPELVASLACSRVLRAVDPGLLQSLRSRSRLWAKERGMSDLDLSFVISGSVTFAALPQQQEVAAVSLLRTDAARWSVGVLGALGKGVVKSKLALGFWESTRRAVRWCRPSSSIEATTQSLRLSL